MMARRRGSTRGSRSLRERLAEGSAVLRSVGDYSQPDSASHSDRDVAYARTNISLVRVA